MTAKSYSRLAALIFVVVAALQLIRAVSGWPITVGATTSIPYGQVGSPALWLGCLPGLDLRHLGNTGYKMHFECPLWVISRHRLTSASCPLFPSKRTFINAVCTSA